MVSKHLTVHSFCLTHCSMRNSSASQSTQLVNVLELDIIYGTAVNNSAIAAVHNPKWLFLLVICHSASYQKSYLEERRAKIYLCPVWREKNRPCAVMNIHNDVGVCFSTVKSGLFFKIIYNSLSFHLVPVSRKCCCLLWPLVGQKFFKCFVRLFIFLQWFWSSFFVNLYKMDYCWHIIFYFWGLLVPRCWASSFLAPVWLPDC